MVSVFSPQLSKSLRIMDVKDSFMLVLPREDVVVEWVLEHAEHKLPQLH